MKLVLPAPMWADIPNVDVTYDEASHVVAFSWEPGVDTRARQEVLDAAHSDIQAAVSRGVHAKDAGADHLLRIVKDTMLRWKDRWVRDSNTLAWELLP